MSEPERLKNQRGKQNMKMSKETYNLLEEAIFNILSKTTKAGIENYKKQVFEEGKFFDFDRRIRWDILYLSSEKRNLLDKFIAEDLSDDNIDTALKKIFKSLGFSTSYEGIEKNV